jgi:hypothetical protein
MNSLLQRRAVTSLKIARVVDSARTGCSQFGSRSLAGEVKPAAWMEPYDRNPSMQTISDQLIGARFCALECSSRR